MKKEILIGLVLLFVSTATYSQSTTITPGSALPQMTTAQLTAISNPVNGMLVYDTNTNSYWFYQQSAWAELPKAGSTSNYWELNGLAGNEIKNTNSGGFWSANATTVPVKVGFGSPIIQTAPVEGNGTRLMWIPSLSALRSGTINNDTKAWDKDSIGVFSVAFGVNSKASGNISTALGINSIASGGTSTAMGAGTLASGDVSSAIGSETQAIGDYSFAAGEESIASGNYSFAMGRKVKSRGFATVALGNGTDAFGDGSTSFGYNTYASGNFSVAMGQGSYAEGDNTTAMGLSTRATGQNSTALGYFTVATGVGSIAMGAESLAEGRFSTTMGDRTKAYGLLSMATGSQTEASGSFSTAIGEGTVAGAYGSFVLGTYNDFVNPFSRTSPIPNDRIFEIGNGTGPGSSFESNSLTILRNSKVGLNNQNTPLAMLDIKGFDQTENSHIRLVENNSNNRALIHANNGRLNFKCPTSNGYRFAFQGSSSTRNAVLNGSGYLGIREQNPVAPLHLGNGPNTWERHIRLDYDPSNSEYGNIVYDFDGFKFKTWGLGDDFLFRNAANTTVVRINDTGNISVAGTVTANGVTLSSDSRLKKDIVGLKNSSNKLSQLNGYNYNWKDADRDPRLQTGMIAQEVQELFPELVTEGEDGFLSVNYTGLIPHLIEAVKNLQKENKSLKASGREYEERLTSIEAKLNLLFTDESERKSRR